MAASLALRPLALQLSPSRLLSPGRVSRWKRSPSHGHGFLPSTGRPPSLAPVAASQSNWFKVIQTAWKVGKNGIEAGANLVPEIVPKPIARIGVAVVAGTIILFLLKSLLSTAFFALAVMGLVYFIFIALNTDEGSRGGGSTTLTEEENLEEARKIMEKYK